MADDVKDAIEKNAKGLRPGAVGSFAGALRRGRHDREQPPPLGPRRRPERGRCGQRGCAAHTPLRELARL